MKINCESIKEAPKFRKIKSTTKLQQPQKYHVFFNKKNFSDLLSLSFVSLYSFCQSNAINKWIFYRTFEYKKEEISDSCYRLEPDNTRKHYILSFETRVCVSVMHYNYHCCLVIIDSLFHANFIE